MTLTVEALRADPAGNVTILVLSPVEPRLRAAAAVALLNGYGGEQAGFIVPPVSGGAARLEMMGGEFCGNALRCLGLWYAAARPGAAGRPVPMEISGVDGTLSVTADPADGLVSARMPLPAALGERLGMPTAEFPGIVHALCREDVPDAARARRLTAALAAECGAPAAGIMYLAADGHTMRPAVYVAGTDTLYFENSCASGSAAAAAILSAAEKRDAEYVFRQPGGALAAGARWEGGALQELTVSGRVTLGRPFTAVITADEPYNN